MTDYAEDVKRYADAADEAGFEKVCERMQGSTRTHRVTFHCFLAEETGTLGRLG